MPDPQDDEATREAHAVDATDMAPTVMSTPESGAVVGALAWSQEDGSAGAEPVPYVDDFYEHDLGTGRRPTVVVPAAPAPAPQAPSRLPRIALGVGILVALIAVAGALASLLGSHHDTTPVTPESSAVAPPSAPPQPSAPAPPPVATTSVAPPPTTSVAPPPTTTAPATTTTTAPPTTTTTTNPPTTTTTTAPPTTTTTTAPPTTTVPPTSEPPTTTVAPTATTVPMTTEYLRIPLVPVPIPITVPQN
ncbi:hypothetical protein [Mycolicibacter hiberniae]|uniref:Uncharacterized protein n=1 Tax=Mycolicibacter hiberniae TaxID=29314 RepID=A0A7I7X9V0_9MYCO|nr:hypothetical protein [Mycolicibacter hiberniae]MCV7087382.1 hypothetical protein [Mycolicibacter hiberniae]ORV67654.1 hypothetical protein AWC09_15825 [Mycolicibacter hiberniae]BBZ25401.1 hypothetical protein MHIB_38190 [Mycolicibacter hiberniae]